MFEDSRSIGEANAVMLLFRGVSDYVGAGQRSFGMANCKQCWIMVLMTMEVTGLPLPQIHTMQMHRNK